MADPDEPPLAAQRPHVAAAPDPDLWSTTLFFGRFEDVRSGLRSLGDADKELEKAFPSGPSRAVARQVIARAGGGLHPTANLVLVGLFTEFKHSDAIEAVALARLGEGVVAVHRTPSGQVRRHALMALLFEENPRFLFEAYLWDRHLLRRRTRYRLGKDALAPTGHSLQRWSDAAAGVLSLRRERGNTGCTQFDEVHVVPGPAKDEFLVALREWPGKSTGRSRTGAVLTIDLPDWTSLHFSEAARRLEVSDAKVDRGALFADHLAGKLTGEPCRYLLVLQPLDSDKLDHFLEMVTDPANTTFPLVEIVVSVPWRQHKVMTITGTRTSTAEEVVQDLRTLHPPFARDWRTVKSVKLSFENRHTIKVNFPPRDGPPALSYSDDRRAERVSTRFSKLLQEHLHVEVASKARGGTTLPTSEPRKAPRANSERWWRALLQPATDAPEEWLEEAVAALVDDGLVHARKDRFFACNSPHVDRRAIRVDSLDCDGEVVMPFDLVDREDPHQLEDDNEVECSAGIHRWRPMRFGLPTTVRLHVEVRHDAMLAHLAKELSHYGEVRGAPGRPGVLTVRLDDVLGTLVYVPLSHTDELDPGTHGRRNPVAWIAGPGARPPKLPDDCIELPDVLADFDLLAARWGTRAWTRRRSPTSSIDGAILAAEPEASTFGTRITVLTLTEEGVKLGPDGKLITNGRHTALRVLWALWQAAVQDEGDRTARHLWSWEKLNALLPEEWRVPGSYDEERKRNWHAWISRTRKALREGSGDPGLGEQVVVSKDSRYRLGDGFVVADERLQADIDD